MRHILTASHKGTLVLLLAIIALIISIPQALHAQDNAPFRVYLTFEDGPTDAYTPQILDILAEYGAAATFFPNGYQIAGREDIMQRIIRDGHAIGNHLWEEPGYYFGQDETHIRESYFRAEAAIRASLGSELPRYDAQTKLFRYPGGSGSPFPLTEGVEVITYNWHVDSDDCGWWLDTSENFDAGVIANVIGVPASGGGLRWNVYEHGDGAVIAFHDINRVTGRVLPVIIEDLLAHGATFEALPRPGDALNTMPVFIGAPPNYTG